MADIPQAIPLAAFAIAASVWVGGYVAIAVVARAATATLDPHHRVAFFRALGRSYLWVGAPALLIVLATGAVLLRGHRWDALLVVTAITAAALVALLGVAVGQARKMTRLRRCALGAVDEQLLALVARGGRMAAVLRTGIGLITLTLVVLGSFLST